MDMHETILAEIGKIEQQYHVRVLHALNPAAARGDLPHRTVIMTSVLCMSARQRIISAWIHPGM